MVERRIHTTQPSRARVVRGGRWTVSPIGYTLLRQGEPVWLSLKELGLLTMLAAHPDRIFSRAELLRTVWGAEPYRGARIVDLHVRRIRRKLERRGGDVVIRPAGAGRYQFGRYESLEEVT